MIRVVIDTNVVVSALLNTRGLPASILDMAAHQMIEMFLSREILAEFETVLRRPHFKFDQDRLGHAIHVIRTKTSLVMPTERLTVCSHAPDNRFVECALAASADYLITGNTKHFPAQHTSTKIVTPRAFIEQLGSMLTNATRLTD